MKNLFHLLIHQAQLNPAAAAILAPEMPPLTYSGLIGHIAAIGSDLRQRGIQRSDRVAMALPPGIQLASTLIAVSCHAVSAPLNPSYREAEFEFYLKDLGAKAIILPAGNESPARIVAARLGIEVIETLQTLGVTPAMCDYKKIIAHSRCDPDPAVSEDVADSIALILHTSGTTSRPKMVPLTQRNLWASAHNIAKTLALTPRDRCLNPMPLFHIHGLMAGLIASLTAGASVICPPGFDGGRFFAWLQEFNPTWYTAVPTMHQMILEIARKNPELTRAAGLRFIRSSSAALPAVVLQGLEEVFAAPVIESYGMTEATHQMSSNPLPPGIRKIGSVGVAAGPEIAIVDELGTLLKSGEKGEVVIRGENVMTGYRSNPEANQSAFVGGWFRTGDQGYLDSDGYLYLTGRLKEMINRGGEKISPREVDEVYLQHPAIDQAVCFAVPHPTLGEDVVLAVVANRETKDLERELKEFGLRHLALFKVPSQFIFLPEIPKGATGKIQRIGMADKLAQYLHGVYAPPETPMEEELVAIWKEVLHRDRIGVDDNFFMLGGDSLQATRVVSRIRAKIPVELTVQDIFLDPTIRTLALAITARQLTDLDDDTLEKLMADVEGLGVMF